MFRRRGFISTYTRLFINSIFYFTLANAAAIVFQDLGNRYLNRTYSIDYSTIKIGYILMLSAVFSLMSLGSGKYVTKAVRIDDRFNDGRRIKEAMEDMNWRIKEEYEDIMIFTSPLSVGLIREEITIRFGEMEIYIIGPHRFVESLINIAKFPYAAYEIAAQEKEVGYY